ncbi:hypothetical protein LTR33_017777, partial [Friedmanniomyces endolithicus]
SAASAASVASLQSAAATTNTDGAISTSLALGVSTTALLTDSAASQTTDSTADSTATSAPPGSTSASDASTAQSTPTDGSNTSSADLSSTDSTTFSTAATSSDAASLVSSSASAISTPVPTSSLTAAPESNSNTFTSSSTAVPTLLPITNNAHNGSGMSHSALTAAVVIPLLLALCALVLGFFCLRRRSRRRNREGNEHEGRGGNPTQRHHSFPGGAAAFLPTSMREKFGALSTTTSTTADSAIPMSAPAMAMTSRGANGNTHNSTYFTGLDTSSQGSHPNSHREGSGEYAGGTAYHNDMYHPTTEYYGPGAVSGGMGEEEARRSMGGTFMDPPPPYKADTKSSSPSSPTSRRRSGGEGVGSPFADPVDPIAPVLPILMHPSDSSPQHSSTIRHVPSDGNEHESEDAAFLAPPHVAHHPQGHQDSEHPAPLQTLDYLGHLGLGRPSTSRTITPRSGYRPGTSRSASHRSILSGRSIDSDQYSDTASVHSAHAARRSMGPVQLVGAGFSQAGEEVGSGRDNPFHDQHGDEEDGHAVSEDGGRRGSTGSGVSALSWRR